MRRVVPHGQHNSRSTWPLQARVISPSVQTKQQPVVKEGQAVAQPVQTPPVGIRPAIHEPSKSVQALISSICPPIHGLPEASVLPHADAVAGFATCRSSKSDKIEAGSVVESLGGSTVGKYTFSGSGSSSGNDVDTEIKDREGFLASVMQLVEDRVEDLVVEHFWRIKGDLLNTEVSVKAQVDASHELLAQQLSDLAMAHETDRRQLQELRKEVQALRSPQLTLTASPNKLAVVTEASAHDDRSADLAARLSGIQHSVQEWVHQALADSGPLAGPSSPVTSTLGASEADAMRIASLMPTGDPSPQVSRVSTQSQLHSDSPSADPMNSEVIFFDLEFLKGVRQGWMEGRRGVRQDVAQRVEADIDTAKETASGATLSSEAQAEPMETPRETSEEAHVAASPQGQPGAKGIVAPRGGCLPRDAPPPPSFTAFLGLNRQGSAIAKVNCGFQGT